MANRKRRSRKRPTPGKRPPSYQRLEPRQMLAATGFYNPGLDTLTITQTVDDGPAMVDNSGPGEAFQFIDGSGTYTFQTAGNLTVTLLADTGDFTLDFDNPVDSSLRLNLTGGGRQINFTGDSNQIQGDVVVNGGSGDQVLNLAVGTDISISGTLTYNAGNGFDSLIVDGNQANIGGTLRFDRVNSMQVDGVLNIGANLGVYFFQEQLDSEIRFNSGTISIGGNFSYFAGYDGSPANDTIIIGESTTTMIGGNLYLELGNGTNIAEVNAELAGGFITYAGGVGPDQVTHNIDSTDANVYAPLAAGDDTFAVGPAASMSRLIVGFGNGDDTFDNQFGTFEFDAWLSGLNGFNWNYELGTNTLRINQVSGLDPITLDNNGTDQAIRVLQAGTTTTATPADNVILNLQLENGGDVSVDLDHPQVGNLRVAAGGRDRTVQFIGSNNSIGGNLYLGGSIGHDDNQLAVNQPLVVSGDAFIAGRAGDDAMDIGSHGLQVDGSLRLDRVNQLMASGAMTIGANFAWDIHNEWYNSGWTAMGAVNVAGNFTYRGSSRGDTVMFDTTASFGGNVYIDLSSNRVTNAMQSVMLGSAFSAVGPFTMLGGDTISGSHFVSDPAAQFDDSVTVFLGGTSANSAVFQGTFNGDAVAFRGSPDNDTLLIDFAGASVDFRVLMQDGDDEVTLTDETVLASLRIDFGDGVDTLIDEFAGSYPFTADFFNLP